MGIFIGAENRPRIAIECTGLRYSFAIQQFASVLESSRAVRTKDRRLEAKLQKNVGMVMRRAGANTFELTDAYLNGGSPQIVLELLVSLGSGHFRATLGKCFRRHQAVNDTQQLRRRISDIGVV